MGALQQDYRETSAYSKRMKGKTLGGKRELIKEIRFMIHRILGDKLLINALKMVT